MKAKIAELNSQIEAKSAEIKTLFETNKDENGAFKMTRDQLAEIEAEKAEVAALRNELNELKANDITRPEFDAKGDENEGIKMNTIGKAFVAGGKKNGFVDGIEYKAVFTRSAGLAPERFRNGHVDFARRNELNLFDVFDIEPIKGDALKYVRETISAGAAEAAEGGAYNEANIALADVVAVAKKVTTILPVTDEVLADNDGLESFLDGRLSYLLRERFESQFINGAGTSDTMLGLIATTGVQTYTRVTGENHGDAMIKGGSKIREGKAGNCNLYIMNPANFTAMRLAKDDNGNYLYAELREGTNPTLDGKTVLLNDAVPADTAIAVDTNHVRIGLRSDAEIEVGYNADDFSKGKKSMRGTMRGEAVVYRPQAVVIIDISDPA